MSVGHHITTQVMSVGHQITPQVMSVRHHITAQVMSVGHQITAQAMSVGHHITAQVMSVDNKSYPLAYATVLHTRLNPFRMRSRVRNASDTETLLQLACHGVRGQRQSEAYPTSL